MGQKGSKSSAHFIREFSPNIINDAVSSSSSSASSSSYSTSSKSNHESAISNDSGCYITDRISSPSGSSVLALFDLANEAAALSKTPSAPIAKEAMYNDLTIKKRVKRNEKGASCEPASRSKTLTKETTQLKRQSLNEPVGVMITGRASKRMSSRTKSTSSQTNEESNRFSLCESLDYSYSLNSSSSSCLNLETIDENLSSSSSSNKYKPARSIENKNDGDVDIDYLQVAAHSLCHQLNQILSISAGLTVESINLNNRQEFLDNLANASKSKSKNDLFKKTLSSMESNMSQSDLSVVINEDCRRSRIDADEKTSASSQSAKYQYISRSHTFHAEQNARRRLNPNQNLPENAGKVKTGHKNLKLVSNEDDIVALEKLDGYKTAKASSKMTKSFLKNGRRLFTWSRKASANPGVHLNRKAKNDFDRTDAPYLHNSVRANSAEDQLINQIAAKLMSESIELAQAPYSDEYGFCKIPIALVKRYSVELKKSVDLVAKCMEAERLSQLEKCGKIGIPNDFLVNTCKCVNKTTSTTGTDAWQACKCDIDLSAIGAFFTRIGLPMYAEAALRRSPETCSTDDYFKSLFKMTPSDIEQEFQVENRLHLSIITSAVQMAQSYLS